MHPRDPCTSVDPGSSSNYCTCLSSAFCSQHSTCGTLSDSWPIWRTMGTGCKAAKNKTKKSSHIIFNVVNMREASNIKRFPLQLSLRGDFFPVLKPKENTVPGRTGRTRVQCIFWYSPPGWWTRGRCSRTGCRRPWSRWCWRWHTRSARSCQTLLLHRAKRETSKCAASPRNGSLTQGGQ